MTDTKPPGEDIHFDLDHSTNDIAEESNTDLSGEPESLFCALDESDNLHLGQGVLSSANILQCSSRSMTTPFQIVQPT